MKSEEEMTYAIHQYGDLVQKICCLHKKQKSDIDYIFQTVFLKYAQAKDFNDREHEKAWIVKVTMNACKSTYRDWFHKHASLSDVIETYGISQENTSYMLDALYKLNENYRKVIYLHYYEGYKIKEIADILHKKENTIHTWLKRAKDELKDLLGGDLDAFR